MFECLCSSALFIDLVIFLSCYLDFSFGFAVWNAPYNTLLHHRSLGSSNCSSACAGSHCLFQDTTPIFMLEHLTFRSYQGVQRCGVQFLYPTQAGLKGNVSSSLSSCIVLIILCPFMRQT
ncbi:hypothetical protein DL96DRAFT_1583660 [Flagelloscypha sp. PMI_526]|nr:hypothetical protein DL96DRAFT_1583660 [Flagelloscypha sp. PMI_526]